jgi:dihydroorotase-like cyclic amidohydrolase
MIEDFNNQYLFNTSSKLSLQGGYPTVFRYCNGKLEYYDGPRTANAMLMWYKTACQEKRVATIKHGGKTKKNKKRSNRTKRSSWKLW